MTNDHEVENGRTSHVGKREEESTTFTARQNPFAAEAGSALDPNGKNFNTLAWCKAMLHIHTEDEQTHPLRTLGIAFSHLNVHGFGSDTDYQKSVGNVWFEALGLARKALGTHSQRRIQILQNLEGVVEAGEMLVVLGPPGSGCSTFLKTIPGETYGFHVDKESSINYQGVSARQMAHEFRGEAIYAAEVDIHFPKLTVGDTLYFVARARAPRHIPGGVDVAQYARHKRDVIMAMLGISHTKNTIVGNDFIRGVSGGERKRVSIAEACLSSAPLQCWDNSTRGLDSANAIDFCKALRMQADINGTTACVSLYQAPQAAYDHFDKVLVLYKGHQIYFGRTDTAKQYFINIGFACPEQQTDANFLTSMTSHLERVVQPASPQRARLLQDIESYNTKFTLNREFLGRFRQSHQAQQARVQHISSPYTLSYAQQVNLITISSLIGNIITALIIASIFFNLKPNTSTFFQHSALLFFACLINTLGCGLEMLTLYTQQGIIEKHSRYTLYHPSTEAISSMIMDLPYKVLNTILSNTVLYLIINLRREARAYFFFIFTSFILTLTISMFFRSMASLTRSLVQALPFCAVVLLGLYSYTGFAIPTGYILGWARWIAYLNPINYSFETLLINKFHNRDFQCISYVPSGPSYTDLQSRNHVCSTVGSVPGQAFVNGDAYIQSAYDYNVSHKWRNVGIILAFVFVLGAIYLVATEFIAEKKSKREILVFPRGHMALKKSKPNGFKGGSDRSAFNKKSESDPDDLIIIERQTAIFQWKNVCFDIKIGKENRRILDHVDGWVKPGILTALMGVSGAGKTTLLDVLATRTTLGVIYGEMLVDSKPRDESFQRKTGYAQQQNLHLSTATVREALEFSALLRQPAHVPRREKIDYVTDVIKLLDMVDYADAVIGVPGEGLNVEQRKRLTIGVELAARPALLLFLDEPTSGLDSHTSLAILDLLNKLRKNGQAILCTIHQPSAMLFQRFDRLLFLQAGGQTRILIDYFVRNGGPPCPPEANPAEWMLDVIGAAPGSHTDIDWFETWRNSPEYAQVQAHLTSPKLERSQQIPLARISSGTEREDRASYREFAAPFWAQLREVQIRVFQQFWRSPIYIYSKAILCVLPALFVGFSLFNTPNTIQGLQNQMFSIFLLLIQFGQFIQQIMPHFVTQRALYEVRERPSKTYSWQVFMLSNIGVELFWNSLMSILMFLCWYYPIGMYRNAEPTDTVHLRGAQMWLLIWTFLLFSSTFAHFMIAALDAAENAGNLGSFLLLLCLLFCGVLATPAQLPGFWIFMYRVSPFTYLVSGMLSVGIADTIVTCADNEYLRFDPVNTTCGRYMAPYIAQVGGYLQEETATTDCRFCPVADTNTFLRGVGASYADVWRNFALMWVFILTNVVAACLLYWWARVPRVKKPAVASKA
ncbi:ABC drug exporter AbcA [Aspergillus steynii IBT 23096]|uniref:ABC drug exporter AbcA n=1 Tax=Aspergillus steynii IBT 23096 TaxID=1392250 RepID=A0A2I2FWM9_9EURO|nr:ABC drug exporter AbcA [Aspergillus steynii IBT 23096]PLB45040.1 ABC drug exporter AbcA [Aspergillus steynii IBT 23096]